MKKVLEFNGASACQCEPAEGKGGDRGRAPSGTKAVCGIVLTVGAGEALCGLKLFLTPPARHPRLQL